METTDRGKRTTITIYPDTRAGLIRIMRGQESYDDVIRRLLGLNNGNKGPAAEVAADATPEGSR